MTPRQKRELFEGAALEYAPATTYRPEIDGLRGFAVLAVIFYHADLPLFSGGFIGVDVFFVISGYLITRILHAESGGTRAKFFDFYVRRCRRILPAFFVTLLLTLIAAWFLLDPAGLKGLGASTSASALFLNNVLLYEQASDYFAPATANMPLLHLWSLSVEEQFYLGYPLLLIVIGRLPKEWRSSIIAICALVSFGLCLMFAQRNPTANFYLAPFRAWELLLGGLIALNEDTVTSTFRKHTTAATLMEWAGFLSILFAILQFTEQTLYPGLSTLFPSVGAACILATTHQGSVLGRVLAHKWAIAIGLISYSAYLVHFPLFTLVRLSLAQNSSPTLSLLMIVATLGVAGLIWRFVERPFRNPNFLSQSTIIWLSVIGSLLFAGAGQLLRASDGFQNRFSPQRLALLESANFSPKRGGCDFTSRPFTKPKNACHYFGEKTSWAVLSDSLGFELSYALAEQLRASNQGVLQLAHRGCRPTFTATVSPDECHLWMREAVHYLSHSPDIKHVMIVFNYASDLYGSDMRHYPGFPDFHPPFRPELNAESARLAFLNDLKTMAETIRAGGKQVYFVAPIPELPNDVQRYIFQASSESSLNTKLASAGTSRAWYRQRQARIRSFLKGLTSDPGIHLLDPMDELCDLQTCHAFLDGKAMYYDSVHPSLTGARRLIDVWGKQSRLPRE